MTRIKICGLTQPRDVAYVNEAKPDFCGFVIDVPGSRRRVTPRQARALRENLDPDIMPVGVFVDADPALIVSLVRDGTIRAVQLHGREDGAYINALRQRISAPIIRAFSVSTAADVRRAAQSSADHILLDNGAGGTGTAFDWRLLGELKRPFILAGGLTPENLPAVVESLRPWGVDLSSGVETDGKKDRTKILAAIRAVTATGTEER